MDRNSLHVKKCPTWCGISLLNLCRFIATFDLIQSLYFLVHSIELMMKEIGMYAFVSLIGSLLWMVMVMLLFVGLNTLRIRLIVFWLVFSLIGVIMDIFVFIWTIAISDYVKGVQIAEFTLLYLGIVAEWLCIYTVYNYCVLIEISEVPNPSEYDNMDLPINEHSLLDPSSRNYEMNLQNTGPKQKNLIEKIEIPRVTDVSKVNKKASKYP